jgi:hypothetical protein
MIIRDLHRVGVAFAPDETNAPLVIDANAVLALAVAMQCLRAISGRRS